MSIFHDAITAIEANNFALFQKYINEYPGIIYGKDMDGNTLLHLAAQRCDHRMLELLLAKGADVNAICNDGAATPLLRAIGGISYKTEEDVLRDVELLIDHGAHINMVNNYGYTPLIYAIDSYSNYRIAEMLIRKGARPDEPPTRAGAALVAAVEQTYEEMIILLFDAGANINARECDETRRTPLHYAVHWGYPGVVQLLLSCGADPHVKDRDGQTPLDIALHKHDQEIVDLLKRSL